MTTSTPLSESGEENKNDNLKQTFVSGNETTFKNVNDDASMCTTSQQVKDSAGEKKVVGRDSQKKFTLPISLPIIDSTSFRIIHTDDHRKFLFY